MSKREKVISQLEALAYCYKTKCADCEFSGRIPVAPGKYKTCGLPDDDEILEAAIELLKEQEVKTGHWVSVNDGDVVAIDNDGFPQRACFCSECKKYLVASDEYAVYGRYCPFCGAKMEGR